MCAVQPMYAYNVEESWVENAYNLVQKHLKVVSQEQAFEILMEIGLPDAVKGWDPLQPNLTDLQLISFAAALHAAVGGGLRVVEQHYEVGVPSIPLVQIPR